MNQRITELRARMAAQGLDALLITRPENQYYLSSFAGGEYLDATLLLSAEQAWIATDSRYYEEVKQRAPTFRLLEAGYDRNKPLADFAAEVKPKTMGFEATHLTVATFKEWNRVARKAGFKLVPTKGWVEELRLIKEPAELELITRAVQLTDRAFAHFCATVQPGMTEKQAAWIIEAFMRENGADKVAFDLIVASGPNGALPHAIPGERVIQKGEPIVVDIGCRIQRYHSDLTRTICLGQPHDSQFMRVYRTVLRSQEYAIKKIRAGIKGKRADALARNLIAKSEFEPFGHGLGHGVGLAVHEGPRASRLSKDVYRAGMTLTIEPGIYIAGWGGVRIEDLVVIRDEGVQVLSQASKEPILER